MSRVPIARQVTAVQLAANELATVRAWDVKNGKRDAAAVKEEAAALSAAVATLRFVEKNDAAIRALFERQRPMNQTDIEDFTRGGAA